MFKLDLEKAEEPERINCQHLLDHQKSKRMPKKHQLLLYWLHQILWLWITTGKFFKRWEYQTTSPASWEICVQIKKQSLEPDKEQTGSKLGKDYFKAVYCHPAYLTYMQSTSCKMLGWMKHKLESRLPGEISITSDMQMSPPLWQKAKRNWRGCWWKEESEKAGLKLNIQKTKTMASGPITSCQIVGEIMETVTDFIFLASKITADGDDSHEIKRCLLLGRKVMTNLDSMLKSRDISLPIKKHQVKTMFFSIVMYGCESWTMKKDEHQRTDAFELWCWRRLKNPSLPSQSQSILKKSVLNGHWKDWCWSSNTLATWCEELTHWKRSWAWEILKTGGEGDDRGWGVWIASLTWWTWVWPSSGIWWWTGNLVCCSPRSCKELDRLWMTELNW